MAYIDQRTGRNQRAAVMTIVAVIQGAAIVALIHGLAVKFIPPPPPAPPPQGEQIRLPPLPVPSPPPKPPRPDQPTISENSQHPMPMPWQGPDIGPLPLPSPQPLPTQTIEIPRPKPTPSFTPHLAKPRGRPADWVSTNDYPARDLREGNQGLARFTLTIGTDGRVVSCQIVQSSGFAGLDAATCSNVAKRARFEPATDGNGNRVTGSYDGTIRWVIPQD